MNLSGQSVGPVARFYKIEADSNLMVVSDDIDLPVGVIRIRPKGSAGGHNGLKSVIDGVGSRDFSRLRIGVGRSSGADATSHVLGKIREESPLVAAREVAVRAIEIWLSEGIAKAMSRSNGDAVEVLAKEAKKKEEEK